MNHKNTWESSPVASHIGHSLVSVKEISREKQYRQKKKKNKKTYSPTTRKDDVHSQIPDPTPTLKKIKKMDENLAMALRRDDEEIERLERKLGLTKQQKKGPVDARIKLHKEYAKLEGYGDDFGQFLDSLDGMIGGILDYEDNNLEIDSDSDELRSNPSSEDNEDSDSSNPTPSGQPDDLHDLHDLHEQDTYKPLPGMDLYGNILDSKQTSLIKKYVTPHLRNADHKTPTDTNILVSSTSFIDPNNTEALATITRQLNSHLNRLSDNTLESVVKAISSMYSSYPCHDVSTCLYDHIQQICVAPHVLMTKLIPLYMACISGIHLLQQTNSVSLNCASYVVERAVLDLMQQLNQARMMTDSGLSDNQKLDSYTKQGPNLILILCYLYNFQCFHCTLLYDIIRNLISYFAEIDVDMLLLIITHAGYHLRLDDPSSLKDIVFSVQQRAQAARQDNTISTPISRVQHMLTAINELKNNKRKHMDMILVDKVAFYRKILGRVKTLSFHQSNISSGDSTSCLRISLVDIINAESKGRWWSLGSSWIGNQHKQNSSTEELTTLDNGKSSSVDMQEVDTQMHQENDALLTLATKYRMNTDTRRTIFCIVMKSLDYDDAFTKLLKAGMLKGPMEKDVVRVLIDCCCREQHFNPFYSHLGVRLCEHSSGIKFTFQLALWDTFSVLNDATQESLKRKDARFAMNLAKFVSTLLKRGSIKLNVLRRLDITLSDISERTTLFLTVLFTDLFESVTDSSVLLNLMRNGLKKTSINHEMKMLDDDNSMAVTKQGENLKLVLGGFFVKYLESSPKNIKPSNFARNLKAAIRFCNNDDDDDD